MLTDRERRENKQSYDRKKSSLADTVAKLKKGVLQIAGPTDFTKDPEPTTQAEAITDPGNDEATAECEGDSDISDGDVPSMAQGIFSALSGASNPRAATKAAAAKAAVAKAMTGTGGASKRKASAALTPSPSALSASSSAKRPLVSPSLPELPGQSTHVHIYAQVHALRHWLMNR